MLAFPVSTASHRRLRRVCRSATNSIRAARGRRIYASPHPQHPWGTSCAENRRKQGHTRSRGRPALLMDQRCWHPPSAPPLIVGYVGSAGAPPTRSALLVAGASTRRHTRSIHGTPHALRTAVSKVTHAHVAALHYLWTSDAGIPRHHRLSLVGYVGSAGAPPARSTLLVAGASTRPHTHSIHGAPHALRTAVSKVTHAHVAARYYLWTSDAGIPCQQRLTSSATSGLQERHQLDPRC